MKYVKSAKESFLNKLPDNVKGTAMIRLFGLMKVPMLFWLRPIVEELSETTCRIKIPSMIDSESVIIACEIRYMLPKSKEILTISFL